jgi:pyrroline-5-carboxylate reductase
MSHPSIAFIGAGNMAGALIAGLIADGTDPQQLVASDPDAAKREALAAHTGVRTRDDNVEAARAADVVVLAVKPQALKGIATELAPVLAEHRPLVISIAAGVRTATLRAWLGDGPALVRAMPNTPAMIQAGASVLYAAPGLSAAQHDSAERILRAVGLVSWVDNEALMDAVTAVSGSGPAYYFLVMEAMEDAARDLGLPGETAHLLTLQTALGAARMAIESSDDPATLRRKVTSPGGTTERAIAVFEQQGLRELFRQALAAAHARSVELSQQLGEQ